MSTVSSATSAQAVAAAASTKTSELKTGLDYDAFLQLLVAQMKNQDPLNPTDPTQQMAQLASFSNVEQSIKLNQKLEAMTTLTALTQSDALIGRTLTTGDGRTTGKVTAVQVFSDGTLATLASGERVLLEAGLKIE